MAEDQLPAPFNGGGQAEGKRDDVGTLVAVTSVHGGDRSSSCNHTLLRIIVAAGVGDRAYGNSSRGETGASIDAGVTTHRRQLVVSRDISYLLTPMFIVGVSTSRLIAFDDRRQTTLALSAEEYANVSILQGFPADF